MPREILYAKARQLGEPLMEVQGIGPVPIKQLDRLQIDFRRHEGHKHVGYDDDDSLPQENRVLSNAQRHLKGVIETRCKLFASATRRGLDDEDHFVDNEENEEENRIFNEAKRKLAELHRDSHKIDKDMNPAEEKRGFKTFNDPDEDGCVAFFDPRLRQWTHPNCVPAVPAKMKSPDALSEEDTDSPKALLEESPTIHSSGPTIGEEDPIDPFDPTSFEEYKHNMSELFFQGKSGNAMKYSFPGNREWLADLDARSKALKRGSSSSSHGPQ